MIAAGAQNPATWARTGWCWGCGPTRRPIAPAEISVLESCADHLPRPEPARQLVLGEAS